MNATKKTYRGLLALLCVGVMLVSVIPSLAQETEAKTTNNSSINQMENEEPIQLTIDDYISIVNEINKKMEPFIKDNYDIYNKTYIGFYYTNFANCRKIREELINKHIIPENLEDGDFDVTILTQAIIMGNLRILKKSTDIKNFLDFSIFVLDPYVKELAHSTLEMYLKTYEKATIDCDEHQALVKQLEELKEKDYFISFCCVYHMMQTLYEHCIFTHFKVNEINIFFKTGNNKVKGVNKSNYKSASNMRKILGEKQDRTELEEYALLLISSPANVKLTENIETAIKRINKDYRDYQRSLQKQ